MKQRWTDEDLLGLIKIWAERYGDPPAIADWNPHLARQRGDEERALRFERHTPPLPYFSTVARRFGSWGKAIELAGFIPRAAHGGDGNELRHRHQVSTHCVHGHEWTDENTYLSPRGYRQCRQCVAMATRRYQARKSNERGA